MIWELYICAAISWGGCGTIHIVSYPDEKSCYKALKEMRVDALPITAGDARRSMYAICRPNEIKP